MRRVTPLSLLICFLWSCNNSTTQTRQTAATESNREVVAIDLSKYHSTKDTVLIVTGYDTLELSKADFNKTVDNHPEFFEEYPRNPELTYFTADNIDHFSSEVGQDGYFTMYAYFLKQKNGEKQFAAQRQKLIDIYLNINSIFGQLEYGGTYFGHQYKRIPAYAEYSIYLMPKEPSDIVKHYDISKQKQLYVSSLRQLIQDENAIDFNTLGDAKEARIKELNKTVDNLDRLITDNFYLRRAQEFHYSHYEYY